MEYVLKDWKHHSVCLVVILLTFSCSLFVKEKDPYELIYQQMQGQGGPSGLEGVFDFNNANIPASGQDDTNSFLSEDLDMSDDEAIIKNNHNQIANNNNAQVDADNLNDLDVGIRLKNESTLETKKIDGEAKKIDSKDKPLSRSAVDASKMSLDVVKQRINKQAYRELVQINFPRDDVYKRYYQAIAYYAYALNVGGR